MKPELSKKWIIKSRKQYMLNKPLKQCHVNVLFCSDHFERRMFANSFMNTLVSDAVPTIFEGDVNLASEEHDNDKKLHREKMPRLKRLPQCADCSIIFEDRASLNQHWHLAHLEAPQNVKFFRKVSGQVQSRHTCPKCESPFVKVAVRGGQTGRRSYLGTCAKCVTEVQWSSDVAAETTLGTSETVPYDSDTTEIDVKIEPLDAETAEDPILGP